MGRILPAGPEAQRPRGAGGPRPLSPAGQADSLLTLRTQPGAPLERAHRRAPQSPDGAPTQDGARVQGAHLTSRDSRRPPYRQPTGKAGRGGAGFQAGGRTVQPPRASFHQGRVGLRVHLGSEAGYECHRRATARSVTPWPHLPAPGPAPPRVRTLPIVAALSGRGSNRAYRKIPMTWPKAYGFLTCHFCPWSRGLAAGGHEH